MYVSEIPSVLSAVAPYVEECAVELSRSLSEELVFDLRLAFTEGITNAIRHAHGEDGRPVRLELSLGAEGIELRVYDSGPGFEVPDEIECSQPFESEHGRGLFLMKSLLDDLRYERSHDHNVLIMRKRLEVRR